MKIATLLGVLAAASAVAAITVVSPVRAAEAGNPDREARQVFGATHR